MDEKSSLAPGLSSCESQAISHYHSPGPEKNRNTTLQKTNKTLEVNSVLPQTALAT